MAFTWDGEDQEQSGHLRQGDRLGAAAPADLRSRAGREPRLVTRRHPDRLPPRPARGRLGGAPGSAHGRTPSGGWRRSGASADTRAFVVSRTAAGWRSWIDPRPWRPFGIFLLDSRERREGATHRATFPGLIRDTCRLSLLTAEPSPSSGSPRTSSLMSTSFPRPEVSPEELLPTLPVRGRVAWAPERRGRSSSPRCLSLAKARRRGHPSGADASRHAVEGPRRRRAGSAARRNAWRRGRGRRRAEGMVSLFARETTDSGHLADRPSASGSSAGARRRG